MFGDRLRVCRTCLGTGVLCPLDPLTAIRLQTCAPLEVTSEGGLPMLICGNCLETLNISYSFREKCIKTDIQLKNYLRNPSENDIKNILVKEELVDKNGFSPMDAKLVSKETCSNINIENSVSCDSNINNFKFKIESSEAIEKIKNVDDKKINSSKLRKNKAIFSCSICKHKFQGKNNFSKHLKTHKEYKKFLCSYCAKSFRLSCTLEAHLSVHTGVRPYKCSKCDKQFTQRSGLSAHFRAFHTTDRPFTCDRCPSKFARKETLVVHQRTHDDVRPYTCNTCGQTFSQTGNLAVHERIHTGEKPYECKICDYRTAYSSQLKQHVYSHTGEKKCICSDCGKTFKNGSTLGRHRRIHTGDLPYKCGQCPRAFIDAWKRSQHVKKNHHKSSSTE